MFTVDINDESNIGVPIKELGKGEVGEDWSFMAEDFGEMDLLDEWVSESGELEIPDGYVIDREYVKDYKPERRIPLPS